MIILTGNPDLQLKKPDNKNIFLWIIFLRAKQDTASNAKRGSDPRSGTRRQKRGLAYPAKHNYMGKATILLSIRNEYSAPESVLSMMSFLNTVK